MKKFMAMLVAAFLFVMLVVPTGAWAGAGAMNQYKTGDCCTCPCA
ncbi:MAG: hypothetical protein OEV43_06925 [Coriobacteriia bacterium]|nr:hypothetical protein [Coriobacteriia bacterium]